MSLAISFAFLATVFGCQQKVGAPNKTPIPNQTTTAMSQQLSSFSDTSQVITLGGGCFWCVEAVFDDLKGVSDVKSGYSGGTLKNPTYRQVCSGTTGHNEVVQVTYNPQIISTEDLLRVFFTVHDPTTLNRQGNDVGTQYRSSVFFHTPEQEEAAKKVILEEQTKYSSKIVTEVVAFTEFFEAEDYHQEYFALNGTEPYCSAVIAPKMRKFRKEWADRLKSSN